MMPESWMLKNVNFFKFGLSLFVRRSFELVLTVLSKFNSAGIILARI